MTGVKNNGYTIVETMIFLAVSSALLVSALMLVGGQQNKTQFSQAVRDIEQQVQDVMNNVSTGYYARPQDFKCSAGDDGPEIETGSTGLGTNKECIFLGRIIHFGVDGTDGEGFNVYNVVGLRQTSEGKEEVTSLADAKPVILSGSTDSRVLKYGLSAQKMVYNDGGEFGVGAVGFFSSLGQYSGGSLVSGSQTVELRPVKNTALGNDETAVSSVVNANNLDVIPSGGVTVCFNSGGTDQHANLVIGGSGRQTSTELQIGSGPCL